MNDSKISTRGNFFICERHDESAKIQFSEIELKIDSIIDDNAYERMRE